MVQLQVDLPDETAEIVRQHADAKGMSVSAYLADVICQAVQNQSVQKRWPEGYFEEVVGSWEGDFLESDELLFEERDVLWPRSGRVTHYNPGMGARAPPTYRRESFRLCTSS
ncbi:MAG: hypothetical protein U5L04_10510 [Trueperaceae bacterium]|nr:hypothetical protein [Trueperaceae bacterium]